MNNGPYLAHKTHKHISREWKNGRWRYEYPPEEYDPKLKKEKVAGKDAYVSEKNGFYYYDDYRTARRKNYEWDMDMAEAKMLKQFNEQKYNRSFKRHLDDTVSDIRKVSDQAVDAGKKKVAEILRSMADKLDD